MKPLLNHLAQYLQQILRVDLLLPQPWVGAQGLPRHLLDSYDIYQTSLLNMRCLLVLFQGEREPSPLPLKKHIRLIEDQSGLPALYVQEGIRASTRQSMLEQQIAFAIPGRQLYLPPMGIDLREHYQARMQVQGTVLSPAAQMIVLGSWLQLWPGDISATALAKRCGYSDMTLSRVRRELNAHAGFGWPLKVPVEWQAALPWLRSPVQRTIWVRNPCQQLNQCPLAGEAALAERSQLAPPPHAIRAIDAANWRTLRQAHPEMQEFDEYMSDALELQLWKYDPVRLLGDEHLVDPYSLYVSLAGQADERLAMALDEMIEGLEI